MTGVLVALAVFQAVLLLWAAIQLSDALLHQEKVAAIAGFLGTAALALAIAWWGLDHDPRRILCGYGDCAALAISVAFIRYWAVNKELEQWQSEQSVLRLAAQDRRASARAAMQSEIVRAAALALGEKPAQRAGDPAEGVTPPGGPAPSLPRGTPPAGPTGRLAK